MVPLSVEALHASIIAHFDKDKTDGKNADKSVQTNTTSTDSFSSAIFRFIHKSTGNPNPFFWLKGFRGEEGGVAFHFSISLVQ